MARKKIVEDTESHDRWLISYADFITLLFAFFVVMYAISSVSQGKYRVLSHSLENAFGKKVGHKQQPDEQDPDSTLEEQLTELKARSDEATLRHEREYLTGVARDLENILDSLVQEGKVRVTQTSRGVNVEINASVLFPPGRAELSSESYQALSAVAVSLKPGIHDIHVEGYTDNVPIKTPSFPSNWELSAARAGAVVRLFVESGIAEQRLTAIGKGPNLPVASNDTPDNRARNRRVAIIVLSRLPETAREVPTGNNEATAERRGGI